MKTEGLKEKLRAAAVQNRISCAAAYTIAEEEDVSPKEVGKILNDMRIKIVQCRLGCF